MKTQEPRRTRARTMVGDAAKHCREVANLNGKVSFAKYYDSPEAFTREVLGFEPWRGQCDVFVALATHDAVTVPAGRAVGKSRLDAAAALWFAFTRPGSRVIVTAPKFDQIQQIFWEELRKVFREAKVSLPGDCAKMAGTGLRTHENSQILGWTAEKPERFQGVRGSVMLTIVDEASGVPDEIFHIVDGNSAGNGKFLLTGNPTKPRGYFRETFRSPRWKCITLPSTESPNVVEGRIVIPGLATREWVEERKREWREDSPMYKIHVLGEVVESEEGRLFSVELIAAAEARWADTPAVGPVYVGIDPAGPGSDGDESAFAVRRGLKILSIHTRRGLTEEGHITEALGLIAVHGRGIPEQPTILVDRDGGVGAKVYAALGAYLVNHPEAYKLVGLRGGEKAHRRPESYDRVRDEVWYSLVDSMQDGLAIPTDVRLSGELAELRAEQHISGRSKVTPKSDLRRLLGRSPDRADSLSIVAWQPTQWQFSPTQAGPPVHHDPYREPVRRGIDPYAAMDVWGAR